MDSYNGSNTVTACSGVAHHLINVCCQYGSCGSFTAYEAFICQEFIVCFPMNFNLSYSTKESLSTNLPPALKQVWHLVKILVDAQWSPQLSVLPV